MGARWLPIFVLALTLAPPQGRAAPQSSLIRAFEADTTTLAGALRAPQALAHWLAWRAWREWVPPADWERGLARVRARAKGADIEPLVRLEVARERATRGELVDAAEEARAAGWLAEGVLFCRDAPLAATDDVALAEGGAVHVALPPWSQPLPLDRLVDTAPAKGCVWRSPFRLETAAHVLLGAGVPVGGEVRVDGERVWVRHEPGEVLPDDLLLDLDLAAGPHVVEVRVPGASGAGASPIYLRLLARGQALRTPGAGTEGWLSRASGALLLGQARPARGIRPLAGVRARLEALSKSEGKGACDAALLLGRRASSPTCGQVHLRARDARALAARPEDPAALLLLATLLEERGQTIASADLLRYARRASPPLPEADVALANLLAERGALEAARESLPRGYRRPDTLGPRARLGVVRVLTLAGAHSEVREIMEDYVRGRLDLDLAALLADRLEQDQAWIALAALAGRVRAAFPWYVPADLAVARALATLSPGETLSALRVPIRLGGAWIKEAARVLHAAGQDDDARRLLRTNAQVETGSQQERLLRRAVGMEEGEAARALGPDERAAWREALATRADPGHPLVGIARSEWLALAADGTSRAWTRLVLGRPLGAGAEPPSDALHLRVQAGYESLVPTRADLLKAGGGHLDLLPDRIEMLDADSPDRVEDETRLALPLDQLAAGDLLVVETLRTSRGIPGLRDRPSDLLSLREAYPLLETHLTLAVPASWPLRTALISRAGRIREDTRLVEGQRVWSLKGVDLPAWDTGVADDLAVFTTFPSWTELGFHYARLFAGAASARADLAGLVARATASARTPVEQIDALHRWVADQVRYYGVELGEHAFVPHAIETVLTRGYGDCKDKASLLAALLAEVGVHAVPVLVASASGATVEPVLPALALFNHLILYLPEQDRFLDPTLPGTPPGYLPAHVAGQPAFVLDGRDTAPRPLPAHRAEDHALREDLTWSPAGPGRTRIEGQVILTGELALPFRVPGDGPALPEDVARDLVKRLYPLLDLEQAAAEAFEEGPLPAIRLVMAGWDGTACGPRDDPPGRACVGFARPPWLLKQGVPAWDHAFVYAHHGRYRLETRGRERVHGLPGYRRVAEGPIRLKVETALDEGAVEVRVTYEQRVPSLDPLEEAALERGWRDHPLDVRWSSEAP